MAKHLMSTAQDGEFEYDLVLNWKPVAACNFKCDYCNVWRKAAARATQTHWTLDDVRRMAADVYDKHGLIRWQLGGPEVTQRLDIIEALTEHHIASASTNLSFDPALLQRLVPPERVYFASSFHPTQMPIDKFISAWRALHEAGYHVGSASIVAWPPLLTRLQGWAAQLTDADVPVVLHKFNGLYQGHRYPAAYTEDELATIGAAKAQRITTPDAGYSGYCAAGHVFAVVMPNGDVKRCPGSCTNYGNVFDGTMALDARPTMCAGTKCPCNHLQALRVPNAER